MTNNKGHVIILWKSILSVIFKIDRITVFCIIYDSCQKKLHYIMYGLSKISYIFTMSLMVFHFISPDVKCVAFRIYKNILVDLDNILDCLDMSESTFFHALQQYQETGNIEPKSTTHGRPQKLYFNNLTYMTALKNYHPGFFACNAPDHWIRMRAVGAGELWWGTWADAHRVSDKVLSHIKILKSYRSAYCSILKQLTMMNSEFSCCSSFGCHVSWQCGT